MLTPGQTHGRVGTYQAGCRCDLCRAARSRYAKRRSIDAGAGRPTSDLVDAAPVKAHIRRLLDGGMRPTHIARVAWGVPESCRVTQVLKAARVHPDTERRILAVQPWQGRHAHGLTVAWPTAERLVDLHQRHTWAELARLLGANPAHLGRIAAGHTTHIRRSTATAVHQLHTRGAR